MSGNHPSVPPDDRTIALKSEQDATLLNLVGLHSTGRDDFRRPPRYGKPTNPKATAARVHGGRR